MKNHLYTYQHINQNYFLIIFISRKEIFFNLKLSSLIYTSHLVKVQDNFAINMF